MFRNLVSAEILETQVRVPFLKSGNSLIGHAFAGKRLRNVRTTLNTIECIGSAERVGNQRAHNEEKNAKSHVPGVSRELHGSAWKFQAATMYCEPSVSFTRWSPTCAACFLENLALQTSSVYVPEPIVFAAS